MEKNADMPKYIQLKNILLKKIKTGVLKPGAPVPSERALAMKYGYSRMTIRQAITQLVKNGHVYREQGRGTFVTKRTFRQRNIMSFSNAVRQKGQNPVTRLLAFEKIPLPGDIAHFLSAPDETPVYYAKRLRMANETPVAVEEVYIPVKICPALHKAYLQASLYETVCNRYGHRLDSADLTVISKLPCADEQKLLQIKRNDPVLHIQSLYYTREGTRVYFEKGCYKGDMYEYNIRIFT